ncbi:hypothetical protein BJY00DRAFT_302316 [Aspergillus carlsbadensis]|nr:hypothetical protein BJY00DRAFT_302316 [Aspergillus carlsbadensis]
MTIPPEIIRLSKPTLLAPMVYIMVLETNIPYPDIYLERGSFRIILHEHFTKARREHHPPLNIEINQIPTINTFKGFNSLLIIGSMYNAYTNNKWILSLLDLFMTLTPVRQRLFHTCNSHIHLHQMYQDQVVLPLISTDVGPKMLPIDVEVIGLYIINQLFTTQAYLVFDKNIDLEHADCMVEIVNLKHDRVEVAKTVLRIFVFDDDGSA